MEIKGKNWTAALAIDERHLRAKKGHIEIVGAGPGDPDLVSVRGRKMLEKADLILAGGEKTITAILPVLDDFERAMADQSDDPAAIKEGMKLIFQKFQKTLESLGVKKIETDGVDFNVDYHEAIAQVPGMGEDKVGKVIDCVQTGYTLNDKVIRFAKVAVGQ